MMLNKYSNLFPDIDVNDPLLIPKTFFECMNDSKFLPMLKSLLSRHEYGHESGLCEFPNCEEENGDFEGVRFTDFEDHVLIVSEEVMEKLLLEASQRYVLINPTEYEWVESAYSSNGRTFERQTSQAKPKGGLFAMLKSSTRKLNEFNQE